MVKRLGLEVRFLERIAGAPKGPLVSQTPVNSTPTP